MKKRLLAVLLAGLMLLSLPAPAMAYFPDVGPILPTVVTAYERGVQEGYVGIEPTSEQTRIYWRTWDGRLQWRVWGITSGRWLTWWADF